MIYKGYSIIPALAPNSFAIRVPWRYAFLTRHIEYGTLIGRRAALKNALAWVDKRRKEHEEWTASQTR